MKRPKLNSGEAAIWPVIALTIIALVMLAYLVLPEILHMRHRIGNPKTQSISNLKQLGTGVAIYQSDYDGYFPPASAMPAVRVVLDPYTKNHTLFKPINEISTTPQFSFNIAGVAETLPPYPGSAQRALNEVAMWSSCNLDKEMPGMFITVADSSVRFLRFDKIDKINAAFEGQFDRKGVKLWPADYLKSLDPLK